jgi:hypothetical protein
MRAIGIERLALVVSAVVVVLAMASGCGGKSSASNPDLAPRVIERSTPREPDGVADTVAPSHCPSDLPSCRKTEGLITYVERVDPDGDGDAHFVVLDPNGITLPGLTAIDVRKGLRPHPLPGVGDLISAAGPVQTGSYDQRQIHALELHVAGR